jgi:hypothetical protein
VLDRSFDAEVAARDHHAVGRVDDGVEVLDGLGLLDLGDERLLAARGADELLGLDAVLGAADERERDVVGALAHGEL